MKNEQRELIDVGERLKLHAASPCTAAPIGSGPAGETCGSCGHCVSVAGGNGRYYKCRLMQAAWTHGAGTDIRAKWPACREWQAIAPRAK